MLSGIVQLPSKEVVSFTLPGVVSPSGFKVKLALFAWRVRSTAAYPIRTAFPLTVASSSASAIVVLASAVTARVRFQLYGSTSRENFPASTVTRVHFFSSPLEAFP